MARPRRGRRPGGGHRPPGVAPRTRERDLYLRLMGQGMSNSDACREVGVNRRTGTRWRYGRTVVAVDGRARRYPALDQTTTISGRFLSQEERVTIADQLQAGVSLRRIAGHLRRSPSTISREVTRNRDAGSGRYRPFAAHQHAARRRPRPKVAKLTEPALRDYVERHLQKRWSPEQIARTLPGAFPTRPELHVVHETIYQALYLQGRGQLRVELTRALRTGRARRKPHRQPDTRRTRFGDSMAMISDRPAEVEDRAVPGHWEGDLIIGEGGRSAIGTLVERSTRYTMLVHLPDGRTAEHVRDALIVTAGTLPAHLRKSLTWDQGSEMSRHLDISVAADLPVYFCDPASPWQRGSNENTVSVDAAREGWFGRVVSAASE